MAVRMAGRVVRMGRFLRIRRRWNLQALVIEFLIINNRGLVETHSISEVLWMPQEKQRENIQKDSSKKTDGGQHLREIVDTFLLILEVLEPIILAMCGHRGVGWCGWKKRRLSERGRGYIFVHDWWTGTRLLLEFLVRSTRYCNNHPDQSQ